MSEHEVAPEPQARTRPVWLFRLASPIGGVLALAAAILFYMASRQADDDKQAVGEVAVQQAVSIQQLCKAGGDVSEALEAAGQCDQADQVRATARSNDVQATPKPVVMKPTRDELVRFTRDAVRDYCAGRKNCRPDAAVLVKIVGDYLEQHPPSPGKDATPQQIADAARAVLTADPDLFRGEVGAQGPPPSDDQVSAAVAVFCADDRCRGAKGGQGDQGVGVVDMRPERDDQGACVWVVTFENPASGERQTVTHPAGDAVCPAVQQPPEETGGGLLPGG
jgi:hypothetical protein